MADNKKIILQEKSLISLDKDVKIHIPDDVEGDMDFIFKLVKRENDKGSYTRYSVVSSQIGEIEISNVGLNQSVALDDLRIGTYQNEYLLYVSFTITPTDAQEQILNAKFCIAKKS